MYKLNAKFMESHGVNLAEQIKIVCKNLVSRNNFISYSTQISFVLLRAFS